MIFFFFFCVCLYHRLPKVANMVNEGAQKPQHVSPSGPINDLFDYDVGLDEILQNVATTSNTNTVKQPPAPNGSGLGLGLDEEVKVSKRRQPVAKLDETR